MTIEYNARMPIVNLESLPRGTGAKYLKAFESHVGTYIAMQWLHKLPDELDKGYIYIIMK